MNNKIKELENQLAAEKLKIQLEADQKVLNQLVKDYEGKCYARGVFDNPKSRSNWSNAIYIEYIGLNKSGFYKGRYEIITKSISYSQTHYNINDKSLNKSYNRAVYTHAEDDIYKLSKHIDCNVCDSKNEISKSRFDNLYNIGVHIEDNIIEAFKKGKIQVGEYEESSFKEEFKYEFEDMINLYIDLHKYPEIRDIFNEEIQPLVYNRYLPKHLLQMCINAQMRLINKKINYYSSSSWQNYGYKHVEYWKSMLNKLEKYIPILLNEL